MRDRGYDAVGVGDHASAVRVASGESPELAVVDLRLPGESGLSVVRDLAEKEFQQNSREIHVSDERPSHQ
jgi:two-component system response regulator RegA